MDAERYLLKWNNHQSNLVTVFDQLYEQEAFTDVTLACDGRSFAAHKVILSACSPYFQQLFISNPCKHPIIFMRDVKAGDLDSLLAFMYRGEINVHQQDLASFLKTAESLQIKGLSDSSDKARDTSKILEAMEKRFCNMNNVSINSRSLNNDHTKLNNVTGVTSLTNTMSPINQTPNINALNRSILTSFFNNKQPRDLTAGPPEKKLKTSADHIARILPQIKNLVSTPPIMTPMPGLVTPISLATNALKSVPPLPIPLPYIGPNATENNNSPVKLNDSVNSKEIKKECTENEEAEKDQTPSEESNDAADNYHPVDTPHPIYLVSGVGMGGGGGPGFNPSRNSTPSQEVKTEDEDLLDDSAYSDEQNSLSVNENIDYNSLNYSEDGLNSDKITYPCRFCGKRFTQTGTCRRHERLHTAPNSFKCPFCQKGFNRKYRLKEHILSSHPEHSDDKDLATLINNSDTTLA